MTLNMVMITEKRKTDFIFRRRERSNRVTGQPFSCCKTSLSNLTSMRIMINATIKVMAKRRNQISRILSRCYCISYCSDDGNSDKKSDITHCLVSSSADSHEIKF